MNRRKPKRQDRRMVGSAPDLLMKFLMRLWAGDTLTAVGDTLVLTRIGTAETYPVPVGFLDELEFTRGWIHSPNEGERTLLTYAGKAALADWMRRVKPGSKAAVNLAGERLLLESKR